MTTQPEIEVHHDMYAPSKWRWVATFGEWDRIESAGPYGSGPTPLDAIRDLLDQIEE